MGEKKGVWRVTLVPRPAAAGATPLTAGWTHSTARCRGFYACYLALRGDIELNYDPIASNVGSVFCFPTVALQQFISQ